MGAHVIRAGVARQLIDLMQRGYLSHIAMNGAGIDVDARLRTSNKRVYVAGDAAGAAQANESEAELKRLQTAATYAHEMGHGLTAVIVGGEFEYFKMWADGSGVAMHLSPGGVRSALVGR